MKSSHKLYAATGGLMIAALMGYAGAFAYDTPTVGAADTQPIEVTSAAPTSATEDTFSLEGISPEETTAPAETASADPATEAAPTEAAPVDETPAETVVPEESAPGVEPSVETANVSGDTTATPAEKSSTVAEPTTPAETTAGPVQAAPAENAPAENAPAEAAPAEKAPAESAPFEVAPDEETTTTAAAPSEVKAAPVVPVTYVAPRHSTVVPNTTVEVVVPDPQAEAPLLTMAKTETAPPAPNANGESQVVWFELPEPAGPALVPGQATPLLNAAVSEEAASVNANVVPATAVQQGAVQTAPQQNVAPARAQAVNEAGTLSRGLARTGSIAQYASLLSAGALILGVALLAGAIATTRRNSHLVDAE